MDLWLKGWILRPTKPWWLQRFCELVGLFLPSKDVGYAGALDLGVWVTERLDLASTCVGCWSKWLFVGLPV